MVFQRVLCGLLLAAAIGLVPAGSVAGPRSAALRLADARGDEPSLIAFLKAMPKGGDLHHHFGAGVYAEEALRHAIQQGLFYNSATHRFEAEKSEKNVPAAQLLRDDFLRYDFFNHASMRGPYSGPAGGHDHFFRTFGIYSTGLRGRDRAEHLVEIVRRARLQNMQYLELMTNPAPAALGELLDAAQPADTPKTVLQRLGPQIETYVKAARADLDRWDRFASGQLGYSPHRVGPDSPVTVRYQFPVSRLVADQELVVAWAAGFRLMQADPRVVGVNILGAEDHPTSREGFDRHMRILDGLYRQFDRPNVSLHAGELNLWISPVEAMVQPIRKSIEVGHARRIGHGISVAWENDLPGLLEKMRTERIAVEVCPTSNAVILGAEGDRHPFRLYRRAGVPLTLNTDDEGVSRSNLTMEYVRAVRAWNLSYTDLKELARNSLEYAFLSGESLWAGRDYRKVQAPYRRLLERGWVPGDAEKAALARSEKATLQVRLERAFAEFER